MAFHTNCSHNATAMLSDRLVNALDIGASPNQAHSVVRALLWYRQLEPGRRHDVLIVTRLDLTLRAPLSRWSCDPTDPSQLSIASQCRPSAVTGWNCTNDILHMVPRRFMGPYMSAVGAPRSLPSTGCCFHASCTKSGGHGCYNALVSRGVPPSRVRYCWPQSQNLVDVLRPNSFFELAQCTDLPVGTARLRPAFTGTDGTFGSGCSRSVAGTGTVSSRGGGNRTRYDFSTF